MRTVIIPQNTMEVFLQLAQTNTLKNIETCGILAGHLAHNRLYITHIIIPKQQGTADSCTTIHEEEIFEVQDEQNLITLGWIHVSRKINFKNWKLFLIQMGFSYYYRHIQVRLLFYHRWICILIVRIK